MQFNDLQTSFVQLIFAQRLTDRWDKDLPSIKPIIHCSGHCLTVEATLPNGIQARLRFVDLADVGLSMESLSEDLQVIAEKHKSWLSVWQPIRSVVDRVKREAPQHLTALHDVVHSSMNEGMLLEESVAYNNLTGELLFTGDLRLVKLDVNCEWVSLKEVNCVTGRLTDTFAESFAEALSRLNAVMQNNALSTSVNLTEDKPAKKSSRL